MSQLIQESSSQRGVWGHILAHMPIPEREEAVMTIGSMLIRSNESLWEEKKCLQEILYEMHGHSSVINTSPRPAGVMGNNDVPSSSSRGNSKRMFQDALTYSKVHYEQDDHHLTFHDYQEEMLELMKKTSFSLEEVHRDKEKIIVVITEENERLEEMIGHLQYMVENSMETGLDSNMSTSTSVSLFGNASNSPPRQQQPKRNTSASSSINPLSQLSSPPRKPSKHPLLVKKEQQSSDSSPLNKIPTKSVRELQESFDRITMAEKEKESLDKYLSEESATVIRSNNNHASPSNLSPVDGKPIGASSKFRQRLKGATSELFLVDDF